MNSTETVKNSFGLTKMPFSKHIGVNRLFHSSSFQEAIARLQIGIENEEAALLSGAIGSGKSAILRCFAHSLDPNAHLVVYIAADRFKIGEIAKRTLLALQVEVPYTSSEALRALQHTVLTLNREKNLTPVLIIDEVQELPLPTLVSLKNLLNYGMDNEILLFLLLAGHPSIRHTLAYPCLEALNRRIRIRYSLRPLSLEETSAYISHHLTLAGVEQPLFTDDAKAVIFQHSKGILSSINTLCFQALIYAAASSKDIIEPSVLEVVLHSQS